LVALLELPKCGGESAWHYEYFALAGIGKPDKRFPRVKVQRFTKALLYQLS